MNEIPIKTRRVLGIGPAWTILWLAFWAILGGIIAIVDPDSIDPGEGPLMMLAIFGPMGLAFGVPFILMNQRRLEIPILMHFVIDAGVVMAP